MSTEAVGKFSPCFSHVDFCSYAVDDIGGDACKSNIDVDGLFRIRDLDGILDERARFESRGCAFEGFTVFLTSALAMFLSRLKDARGGSENIWLVSGCFKNMT